MRLSSRDLIINSYPIPLISPWVIPIIIGCWLILLFVQKGSDGTKHQSNTVYKQDGIARTLNASDYKAPMMITDNIEKQQNSLGIRIRKLTPKECWRLMGFGDEDYEKASKVNSKSQLYKQAGNSIVVNVLEEIFKKLL